MLLFVVHKINYEFIISVFLVCHKLCCQRNGNHNFKFFENIYKTRVLLTEHRLLSSVSRLQVLDIFGESFKVHK